ncbi:aa3-type cytochrome c oxidase subunit IV [Acuticoccus sp. MNP-M23]|uniref:aa3-type cytochrome c oxidase subunit IV n=1 Tax=Acuticoccus sp. MNP-M23 TaxID=3072793 RepID=UPI0028167378|nr:aa3-type cytochrome c oxidase subunit IV [Acuticoccus sp. MNP-M23]WMS44977.1 aa3-type cytochrome c oxidase subunit IV [Acuticoccus sp. MNP-M23]
MAQPVYQTTDPDAEPPRTTIEEHQQTYDGFISLTKWSTICIALLLIGMAVFLV